MGFFDTTNFFIDEKVNFLKFANEYKVFNEHAEQIGVIKQKLSGGQKFLRLFINKASMPFRLDILNSSGAKEASISRNWTFFLSKISINGPQDEVLGKIKQKMHFLKPKFQIFDNNDNLIAEIKGDWKAWNFDITDTNGQKIGIITKKWAGVAKEFFTTADKYNVNLIDFNLPLEKRIAVLSSAITIDMVLKEN